VNGSDELLAYIGERLGAPVGGQSRASRCTLRHVECLGYCDRAPVMEVDYRPYGPLTREMIDRVLAEENLLPDSGPVEDGVAQSSIELSGTLRTE
jgi:NADH-quinone oxidoreductase subunit E